MLEFPRWKAILVVVLVLLSVVYAAPNLFPKEPAVQIKGNRGAQVDTELSELAQGALDAAKLEPRSIAIEDGTLTVRMPDPESQLLAADVLRPALGDKYTVALNLAPTTPAWMEAIRATPLLLGLDLQGGVHFLMEVDEKAALDKRLTGYVDDIRALLRRSDIRYAAVDRRGGSIAIVLRDATQRDEAAGLIGGEIPELVVEDEADPAAFIATPNPAEVQAVLNNALEQNIGTLRNRIGEIGVSEEIVQRQGANRIVVQLPGIQDTAQAKKILGATATLEYRAQVDGNPYDARDGGRVPADARLYSMRELDEFGQPRPVLLSKRVIAAGDQLVDARSGFDPQDGTPMVSVTLNNAGGSRMLDFTRENVGRGMGVVFIERTPVIEKVDGVEKRTTRVSEEVINLATIRGVFSKEFQTSGLDSSEEARDLALLLRAGSLAAPIDIVEERVIGPSLGRENIRAGVDAIILGFIAVCVLMIFYYRVFGVISVLALLTNLLMLAAVLSAMDATLTMPGIAGIVLTLGMAIDGNVLICERIREELRAGTPPASAIKAGYERAWTVILDSNVAKLIAAMALFSFGSGPVRGFATVLFFGVLTSMFTSVTVSRAMATLVYGRRRRIAHVSV